VSIIRISILKDELYAPDAIGNLNTQPFTSARGRGFLGPIPTAGVLLPNNSALQRYVNQQVETAAANLPPEKPVVVMIHGFLFDVEKTIFPDDPPRNDNPHGRLYHFVDRPEREEIREHTTSWPRQLGFAADDGGAEGIAIAFGWYSSPGLASSLIHGFKNNYSRAYDYAEKAAWGLIAVLRALLATDALAGRKIDLFCHSLGSRVVVRAMAILADSNDPDRAPLSALIMNIGRVVLLGGSEYVVEAQVMMHRVQQVDFGPVLRPDFFNIVSRENDVLDTLGENFGPRTFGDSRVIGHKGLAAARSDIWMDLAIDSGLLRQWMREQKNHDVSGDQPGAIWDHWYYYTYRGNMAFYRDLLRNRGLWDIAALRAEGIPDGVP
jgi:hypothetical protein